MFVQTYSSRDDMKSSYTYFGAGYLMESGREGMFVWTEGDFTAQLTADTAEGIYIKSDFNEPCEGAFVRAFDGPMRANWFGVVAGSLTCQDTNTAGIKSMMALAAMGDAAIRVTGLVWLDEAIELTTGYALDIRTDAFGGFVWSCQNGGMHIEYTDIKKAPKISGISFLTGVADGGKGLRILAPNSPFNLNAGPLLENLRLGGFDEDQHYWTTQTELQNCWYAVVRNYRGKGKEEWIEPFSAAYGIHAIDCQGLTIEGWKIFHTATAYLGDGSIHGEGINFSGGEIVGCSFGIVHTPSVYKPCISVHDMHINAYQRAMVFQNVGQMRLHDIHVYKTHVSSAYWEGIDLDNCHGWHIHHIYGGMPGCLSSGANFLTLDSCKDMDIDHLAGSHWVGSGALAIVRSNNDDIRIAQLMIMENAPQLTPYAVVGTNNTRITIL